LVADADGFAGLIATLSTLTGTPLFVTSLMLGAGRGSETTSVAARFSFASIIACVDATPSTTEFESSSGAFETAVSLSVAFEEESLAVIAGDPAER
jgi:hypothetical protein